MLKDVHHSLMVWLPFNPSHAVVLTRINHNEVLTLCQFLSPIVRVIEILITCHSVQLSAGVILFNRKLVVILCRLLNIFEAMFILCNGKEKN